MGRKKKSDTIVKAVPLPESDTNMKDTWNPAELNEESKTKDTWNPAVLNEELKRFDSWNPAEINQYLNSKYNLEAVHDANIDDGLASFVTLEPSTIQEIDYSLDQETGSYSQIILQSSTNPPAQNHDPYVYRQIPSAAAGKTKELMTNIIGASVVWNQLAKADKPTTTQAGVTFTNNGDGSWTLTGTPSSDNAFYNLTTIQNGYLTIQPNHVYFMSAKSNKTKVGFSVQAENASGFQTAYVYIDDIIYKAPNFAVVENTKTWARLQVSYYANTDIGTVKVTPQIFDLTAEFGSTIADYVYSLEQATAGSGIAWLKSYGFFTEKYYAYSANTIQSVSVSGHKVVGFNQWDEVWEVGGIGSADGENIVNDNAIRSKNFIPCFPMTTYYCKAPTTYTGGRIAYYDKSKTYLGVYPIGWDDLRNNQTFTSKTNAYYFRFFFVATTYNNDICINISSEKNGTYEPYTEETTALDHTTLRGIFKLDANNNLYADGDIYNADGSEDVKYEERAYASGDESLPDTITDGTTTVTKKATPTTATLTPFNPLSVIEEGGTEEFIDYGVEESDRDVSIPAGAEEYYFENATVVEVPDPPETLTEATISIDNEGIVTITDTSGEEPATYTTSITMPDTLQGDNYMVVTPGTLTGVKYTRIQPKIRRKN